MAGRYALPAYDTTSNVAGKPDDFFCCGAPPVRVALQSSLQKIISLSGPLVSLIIFKIFPNHQ